MKLYTFGCTYRSYSKFWSLQHGMKPLPHQPSSASFILVKSSVYCIHSGKLFSNFGKSFWIHYSNSKWFKFGGGGRGTGTRIYMIIGSWSVPGNRISFNCGIVYLGLRLSNPLQRPRYQLYYHSNIKMCYITLQLSQHVLCSPSSDINTKKKNIKNKLL